MLPHSWKRRIGDSPSFLSANLFKKVVLNSGQLLILLEGSLLYQTLAALLRVMWNALHFITEVAPLKLILVL